MSVKAERVIAIAKDIVLFVGGLSGIGYQQITNNINVALLSIFVAMIGIPGITNIISLWKSGISTGLPQSQSPPTLPQPESQQSSKDKRLQ